MTVAVAYHNGEIGQHFGHADMFAIYEYEGADVMRCTKRLVETDGRHGHEQMAQLMRELHVDAVISGSMGGEAKAALLSLGIVPIAGFEGDADKAADLLILGELPILQGGGFCSGGSCGDCGGCSGCGSAGDCGCGC